MGWEENQECVVLWKPSEVTILRRECVNCYQQIKVGQDENRPLDSETGRSFDLGKTHFSGVGKAPKEQV